MILKCFDTVIQFRVEVVSVSGVLATGEDEADLVAFEVDLNEGRLDQVCSVSFRCTLLCRRSDIPPRLRRCVAANENKKSELSYLFDNPY